MSKATAAAAAPDAPAADKANEIKTAMREALPPISALLASACKARESGIYFNSWEVVPDADTPIENLERREFWANVSQKMRPGDTIIALARNCSWYAELVVFDAGQNWANVVFKFKIDRPDFTASAPGVDDDFDIMRDPIEGYVIKRKSSGVKVKGNFPNAEDARRWIRDHQRTLRA